MLAHCLLVRLSRQTTFSSALTSPILTSPTSTESSYLEEPSTCSAPSSSGTISAYEEFAFVNYGPSPLQCHSASDLAPISPTFSRSVVCTGKRKAATGRRGLRRDLVLLSYEGLDKQIRQTRIRCDPAPKSVLASELRFEVNLQPAEKSIFHLAISCDSRAARRFN